MFGLGFTEILLIAVIALLFIGPDKLPDTMRQLARGLGKMKRMFDETKTTIENELRVDDLREEALQYKNTLAQGKKELSAFKNIANKEFNDVKQSATLTSLNDDTFDDFDDFDKEFDEAESAFSNLDKAKEPSPNKEQEPKKVASGFKHLKPKES